MPGYKGDRTDITRPVTSGASGAVLNGVIVVEDAANPGNVKVAGAGAIGFSGVTLETTDTLGYTSIRTGKIAEVTVNGSTAVAAGDYVTSDASGHAVTIVPTTPGTAKLIIGIALNGSAASGSVDVLIQPFIGFS